ncbi:hypothetical protein [Shimia biformata]|nr:hypothetical protein [Shimia biformata]
MIDKLFGSKGGSLQSADHRLLLKARMRRLKALALCEAPGENVFV